MDEDDVGVDGRVGLARLNDAGQVKPLAGNDRFFAADGTRDPLSGGLGTDVADADADDVLANIEIT